MSLNARESTASSCFTVSEHEPKPEVLQKTETLSRNILRIFSASMRKGIGSLDEILELDPSSPL